MDEGRLNELKELLDKDEPKLRELLDKDEPKLRELLKKDEPELRELLDRIRPGNLPGLDLSALPELDLSGLPELEELINGLDLPEIDNLILPADD